MVERSRESASRSGAEARNADQAAAARRIEDATEQAYGADSQGDSNPGSGSQAKRGAGADWNQHKRSVSEGVRGISAMLREVAEQLQGKDQENIARMLRDGASSLDRARESLDRQDADALINEAREYARRRPGVVVFAAAVLGFIFGRMTVPRRRG